jgi:PAS domain S-box-containing protein
MENLSKQNDTALNTFMQGTTNLKWVTDIDNNLVYANQSFLEYFKVSADVLNKNISDTFPKHIADTLTETFRIVQAGKKVHKTNMQSLQNDGASSTLLVNSFIINEEVNPTLLAYEAIDISEKIKKQEIVKRQTERLIYMNRVTSEAIWEWDISTGQIFRNQQMEKLTGCSQEETKDLSWWFNRIHINDRERVQSSVAEALENKKTSWEEEYHFESTDGIFKIVHDRGFVLYENDKPVKMIGSLQDITEIKELRLELIQEKIMHQKELSESIVIAQEKERLLLGNELHDNVNQILTTARLYLDMINLENSADKEIKDKTKEFIVMAYDEIRKLSRELVSPQLKASSITIGIQELVDDIEASGQFNIIFNHDPIITVSKSLKITLYRIVQEQLKNIIRYSKATDVAIELRSPGNQVVLSVTDNGIGFDSKKINQGIGLSNIYERVKLYDGVLDLDTAPGKGCRIVITIPL